MDSGDQEKSGKIKNSEYKELVDFLSLKFENIDKKFENIDRKFEAVDKKIDTVAARLGTKIDDYHAEQIGMRRRLDQHEKWHFKVATKVGVDLREN